MKKNTREIVELIGIFGVIASLIFVGLQLLMDRRTAMGAQFHERINIGHEWWIAAFENENYIEIITSQYESGFLPNWWNEEVENYKNSRNLSMKDIVYLEHRAHMLLVRHNNNFYQYKLGLITEESFNEIKDGIRIRMRDPLLRSLSTVRTNLEPEFVQFIQEVVHEFGEE